MAAPLSKDPAAPAAPDLHPVPKVPYPPVLKGQPALVTGANSGIGKAVAIGLAQAGADVVINYVSDPAAAEDVAHQIEALGRRAIAIKADVSKEDEVIAMFARAVDHFGTLHVVVSNAGLQRDAPFDQVGHVHVDRFESGAVERGGHFDLAVDALLAKDGDTGTSSRDAGGCSRNLADRGRTASGAGSCQHLERQLRAQRRRVEIPPRRAFLVGAGRIVIRQKIGQADLAAMAGIARENVSRILNDWKRRKLVSRLSGYYCLENKAQLQREAEL